ncbi:Alpha/Beta hydrolase protein [Parachaetomium inaequale]|uniref:Alpha/Beta hydrolase protein n=1 Tax=Parachaetomium inaequale TaxID=2588326 RepID=A0AAN6PFU4_9PEZI|nr:Alpha/Beta hydrolase protein [Parachaetomium inaequale]
MAIPKTPEEILATGIMDPEFEAAWKARGFPSGAMPADVPTLKRIVESSLPGLQAQLAKSRPANITETEHTIPLSTGFASRLLVCHTTNTVPPATPSPIILLFHGGIHVLGHPEFDLPLARHLALAHNATVILPSTRKAPEHPFPLMIDDAWAALQAIAHDASIQGTATQKRLFLPAHADAAAGFIVGGASSGANFSDVVAHLARDAGLTPPLTGQFLACGGFMDAGRVPEKYRGQYLSREQNRGAPVADGEFMRAFREAIAPDPGSPLWAPFVQGSLENGGVAEGHRGMPKVYFQVCGMDINRDDGLIYERVLREECGIQTRLDLYSGFPHCWWDMYPELEASKKRMEDTMAGFAWLLASGRS